MEEKILLEGVTNPISPPGFVVKNGHGILTTTRFIYGKHSFGKIFAMGLLANLTRGDYEYEIPLHDIATVTTGRFRLGHALTISKKDGTILKYAIFKPGSWQAAFDQALSGAKQESDVLMKYTKSEAPNAKTFALVAARH